MSVRSAFSLDNAPKVSPSRQLNQLLGKLNPRQRRQPSETQTQVEPANDEEGSRMQSVLSKQRLQADEPKPMMIKSPSSILETIEENARTLQLKKLKVAPSNPFKPEITDVQEKHTVAENLLLNLGGGHEMKDAGKKAIADNINTKPSHIENLYNYDPNVLHFDKKNKDDFPTFKAEGFGKIVSQAKPKPGLKKNYSQRKYIVNLIIGAVGFLDKLIMEKDRSAKFEM